MKKLSLFLSLIMFLLCISLGACKPNNNDLDCSNGHIFKNYVYNNDAKCLTNGTETSSCARIGCEATDTREKEGSMLNHKFEVVEFRANTCTEDGVKAHYKCSRCEHIFNATFEEVESSEIVLIAQCEMDENTWFRDENGHYHKCKICNQAGETVPHQKQIGDVPTQQRGVYCKDCGWELEPPLPHQHILELVAETQSTCLEHGYLSHYKCLTCDSLFSDADGVNKVQRYELQKEFAHEWEEKVSIIIEATYKKQGLKANKCKYCDEYINPFIYLWDDSDFSIRV